MLKANVSLNPEQQRAVTYTDGPLLIVAGAGTGKTTVITERIKWLIQEKDVKPENILALTFTEKAAEEMEERVDVALPLGYARTWILTFHGFCERVLRQEAIHIGLDPAFNILSEAETQLFIRNNLFEFDLDYFRPQSNPTKFLHGLVTHFSRLKDEDVSPDDYLNWVNSQLETRNQKPEKEELEQYKELATAYRTYEDLKVEHSVMDFSDLISNTLKLFRERPNLLKSYQEKFPYLLIDEFQDTNYAQNHLAIMLAGDKKDITAVCDDDQSIFRWRGAAVYNVLDFKKHFPETEIVTLTQNYRSNQDILDTAYKFIQHNNPDRLEVKEGINKRLTAELHEKTKTDHPVQIIWEERVEDEAEQVVNEIKRLDPKNFSDVAILVRANNHAEPFTRALSRHGIPFQFLGPGRLFRQNEVKDLIAYLKILDNFENNQAMYRLLENPVFQLAGRDIVWIINKANQQNISIFRFIEKFLEEPDKFDHGLAADTLKTLKRLLEMLTRHLDRIKSATPGELLYYFLEDTGQLAAMKDPQSTRDIKRIENTSAFFDKIKTYETLNLEANVHDFVEYLDFVMQAGESPLASEIDWVGNEAVNILTIHSAKGLEFDYVFLVNLVHLRFPTMNRSDQIPLSEELIKEPEPETDPHIGEERRLFYVGLTRAKRNVYLTGAKFYHQAKRPKKISAFVTEALGEDLSKYRVRHEIQHDLISGAEQFAESEEVVVEQATGRPRVNYLTYSRINTFQTCPLHYKLDYLLRIPKLPNAALSFGDSIHKTLRDLYTLIQAGDLVREPDTVYEQAVAVLEKNWSPIGYKSKEHEEKQFNEAKRMLRNLFEQDLKEKREVKYLEEPFVFKLAPDLKIGGRIDRVDTLADGTIEVIDYKTGSEKNKRKLKKDLQLTIYAMALNHPNLFNRPLEEVKVSYYYLETGNKVSLAKTKEDLKKAEKEILEIRDQIDSSNFECSSGYICRKIGCKYELFCD